MATSAQIADKASEILEKNENPLAREVEAALDAAMIGLGIDPDSGAGMVMGSVAKEVMIRREGKFSLHLGFARW